MDVQFAPWRMAYIKGEKAKGCVFCKEEAREDDLLLWEGTTCLVMLNRYPYNNGHLLVMPARHVANLEDLTGEERTELFDLLDRSVRVLREVLGPEGINVGINLGRAAGAGVEDHLHIHVVPRWSGDTNSMTVVGGIRVIPDSLTGTRDELKPCFEKAASGGVR
ncbi:MAG: HIT family hydrolase [Deltaproteobacteria bacterium HGW-Deltaproteobacteria-19]|jgi:ATP adenylyltransferase|nr:MAG: HIT family hydrolase [Deltaproteobacteria bacterium HGW-Deltaproteobacteria-19]